MAKPITNNAKPVLDGILASLICRALDNRPAEMEWPEDAGLL